MLRTGQPGPEASQLAVHSVNQLAQVPSSQQSRHVHVANSSALCYASNQNTSGDSHSKVGALSLLSLTLTLTSASHHLHQTSTTRPPNPRAPPQRPEKIPLQFISQASLSIISPRVGTAEPHSVCSNPTHRPATWVILYSLDEQLGDPPLRQ